MSRSRRWGTVLSWAHVLAVTAVAVGCGMRGRPLPPLVFVPAAVTSLEIQRFDDEVFIRFDVPSENTDGSKPADLERVDVYALTTQPDPEQPVSRLPLADWLDHATMVATIPIDAGLPNAPRNAAPEPSERDVVSQGDEVTLVEMLTPDVLLPVAFKSETIDEDEAESEQFDAAVTAAPFVLPAPPPRRRTYLAIGVSVRGRESAPSSRINVTLADAVSAPSAPTVTYTETEVFVEWVAPPTARLPIQKPVMDAALASEPIVEFPAATTYLVYVVEAAIDSAGEDSDEERDDRKERPEPLNLLSTTETSFVDVGVTFGEERCYAVRALDEVDSLQVRGPASPLTCVTPVDTFAPQPPVGVIAVASRDAISLVWNPSPAADVAGYRVLRGTAPGATLQPLTREPIVETTYRDAEIVSDQRYVYAVQAVDSATPANVSLPSEEVTEQAR